MISQRREIIDGYYGTRTDVNDLIKVNNKWVLRDTCYKDKKEKKRKKEKKERKEKEDKKSMDSCIQEKI